MTKAAVAKDEAVKKTAAQARPKPAANTPATRARAVKTAKPTTAAKSAPAAAKLIPKAKARPEVKQDVKPQAKPETKPAAKTRPEAESKEKQKKAKLVRDSFTMPEAEYAVLGEVKKACLKAGVEVKKSELLRVGVALIRQLDIAQLKEIVAGLPALKAGRPKKGK